jgi:hypothetical protein
MAGDEDFCCALECAACASFAIKHLSLQQMRLFNITSGTGSRLRQDGV